jgi:hypothetical protein
MGAEAHVHSSKKQMVGSNDLVKINEIITIGGTNKERVALQHKARKKIEAIERKANGQSFFL